MTSNILSENRYPETGKIHGPDHQIQIEISHQMINLNYLSYGLNRVQALIGHFSSRLFRFQHILLASSMNFGVKVITMVST
jgi:hypothetical protein